jgi:hypothetical protein
MEYIYKKKKDGNHFFKIGEERSLHIFHIKNDAVITEIHERLTTTSEFKKDDCCINIVHDLDLDTGNFVDSSKEEFENKLKEVVFILGIYEFCKVSA